MSACPFQGKSLGAEALAKDKGVRFGKGDGTQTRGAGHAPGACNSAQLRSTILSRIFVQLSATQNATHELQSELQRVVFVSLQLKCNS